MSSLAPKQDGEVVMGDMDYDGRVSGLEPTLSLTLHIPQHYDEFTRIY